MLYLRIVLFFPLLVLAHFIFSDLLPAEELVLGRETGWDDFVIRESIVSETLIGDGKEKILVLEKQSAFLSEGMELLLSFEPDQENELYHVTQGPLLSEHARAGSRAAWFNGTRSMKIDALPGSLFYEGGHWGDFSIEFWYYPLSLSAGGEIFQWHSLYVPETQPSQRIRVSLQNHRVVWDFNGIFFDGEAEQDIRIEGPRPLVPLQWQRHKLSYFHDSRKIVYYVDGQEEVIYFATDTRRQRAERQYSPIFFPYPHLDVGANLFGLLDDLFITTHAQETGSAPAQYAKGSAISRVFDLKDRHSTVRSVNLVSDIPPRAEIRIWYRVSDTLKSLHTVNALGESWRLLPEDGQIEKRGRFMQYKIEMYPDPLEDLSPQLISLRVHYEPAPTLRAPIDVQVKPGDGRVVLAWKGSHKAAGYRIYVGTSPSFDVSDLPIDSPIVVGESTSWMIQGLENGVGYFFAVAAYREEDDYRTEARSMPVFTRPFAR